jgi:hypothetical protein
MQTPSSPGPVPARWAGWDAVGAVLGGAALGSAGGPVAACELSAALAPSLGACVPAGAGVGALAGALVGLGAAPLCRHGSSRRRPAGHRPAGSTRAAAWLVVTAVVAVAWVWSTEWLATEDGLEQVVLLLVGFGVAIGGAVLIVLALGLLRRRGWARWGAVVGFSLAAVAALSGVLATARVALEPGVAGQAGAGTSPAELVPPVVALVVSVAVVVLVLSPATARDFRRIGQPPPGGGDRRQGTDG